MTTEFLKKALDDLRILREKNLNLIESISQNNLTVIPDGFSNHIYWHAGHILTVQESLLYRRSNLEMHIPAAYLTYFAKGTSPADFDESIPEISDIIKHLTVSLLQIEKDILKYQNAKYDEPVLVSFGMKLNSFADALLALPYHEAYHFGSMKLLQKFLK